MSKELKPRSWSLSCSVCGACSVVCPSGIEFVHDRLMGGYTPVLIKRCIGCGVCEKVCPSLTLKSSKHPSSTTDLIGGFRNIYVGYAIDKNLRWIGSSGGVASALTMYMLNEKLVNAVLAVSMSNLTATPIWIRDCSDIFRAIGSKYIHVPLLKSLRDVSNSIKRFAVVGLPCHIHALNLLRKTHVEVDEKLYVSLGLFCSRVISHSGLVALLIRTGVKKLDEVLELNFRGRGWPGFLCIILKNGKKILMPYFSYWRPLYSTYFYTPLSCLSCNDATNEAADISLGDPWLPRFVRKENVGLSLIIVRTKKGEEIVLEAVNKGYIHIEELDVDSLVESQWRSLLFKKFLLGIRLALLEGRRDDVFKYGFLGYCLSIIHLLNALYSTGGKFHNLIVRAPKFFLEAYAFTLSRLERYMWVRLIHGIKNPRDQ